MQAEAALATGSALTLANRLRALFLWAPHRKALTLLILEESSLFSVIGRVQAPAC
jgi:hypothetical protein